MADITLDEDVLNRRITDAAAAAAAAEAAKYGDYATLQAAATELAALKQANETDADKRIREAKEAAEATIEPRVSKATDALRDGLLRAALRAEAAILGFKHPDDVIDKLVADKTIKVKADGTVEGATEAVKKLAADRPEWVGAASGAFAPGRPQGTQPIIVPGNNDPDVARALYMSSQVDARRAALGLQGNSI